MSLPSTSPVFRSITAENGKNGKLNRVGGPLTYHPGSKPYSPEK